MTQPIYLPPPIILNRSGCIPPGPPGPFCSPFAGGGPCPGLCPFGGPPLGGPLKLPGGGPFWPPGGPGGNGGRFCPGGPPFGGKGGIPGRTQLSATRFSIKTIRTYPVAGIHLGPCLEDPCQEEAACSEGKGAHLEAPSCREGAYLPGQEALADDLNAMRNAEGAVRERRTYHRREGDHQIQGAARRSPWEDRQTAGRGELDAEDQIQTHREGDYRSRTQL